MKTPGDLASERMSTLYDAVTCQLPTLSRGPDVDRKRDGESDGKPDGKFDRRPTEPTGRAPSLFFCYDVTSGEGLAT